MAIYDSLDPSSSCRSICSSWALHVSRCCGGVAERDDGIEQRDAALRSRPVRFVELAPCCSPVSTRCALTGRQARDADSRRRAGPPRGARRVATLLCFLDRGGRAVHVRERIDLRSAPCQGTDRTTRVRISSFTEFRERRFRSSVARLPRASVWASKRFTCASAINCFARSTASRTKVARPRRGLVCLPPFGRPHRRLFPAVIGDHAIARPTRVQAEAVVDARPQAEVQQCPAIDPVVGVPLWVTVRSSIVAIVSRNRSAKRHATPSVATIRRTRWSSRWC